MGIETSLWTKCLWISTVLAASATSCYLALKSRLLPTISLEKFEEKRERRRPDPIVKVVKIDLQDLRENRIEGFRSGVGTYVLRAKDREHMEKVIVHSRKGGYISETIEIMEEDGIFEHSEEFKDFKKAMKNIAGRDSFDPKKEGADYIDKYNKLLPKVKEKYDELKTYPSRYYI